MSDEKKLSMSFDPKTIEHLGIKMYSTLPPILAELVANSYDADAENVAITLLDSDGKKEIIFEDDGSGMTFAELNSKFLRIGRNRRYEEGIQKTPIKKRMIIGKKGLGNLSFFGIAQEIEVSTKKGKKENSFKMRWEDIKNSTEPIYHPTIIIKDKKSPLKEHGTKIILREIKRKSDFRADDLATSLSKLFIVDPDFMITIQNNSETPITVKNERKYEGLDKEVEWKFPEDIGFQSDYENKDFISGFLFSTKKPISPKTNMRGVTLFSRKKLVNAPEYFSEGISSHFFSYLTGWLEVDFIDDLEDDVISTNRQSLNWDHPEISKLRDYLSKLMNWFERDWREKRTKIREEELGRKSGINISDWFSKLPEDIREKVEPIITAIFKDSEFPEETNKRLVKNLLYLAPAYPRLHWRHLHPEVQRISQSYYISKDYYTAVFESIKHYINSVKIKTGSTLTDRELLENIFNIANPKLSVTKKFKKPDGEDFETDTIKNINEGHRMLVIGTWQAFRCQFSHEVVADLRDSGLFTEKDCLDALGLLSHLFRRLDDAK